MIHVNSQSLLGRSNASTVINHDLGKAYYASHAIYPVVLALKATFACNPNRGFHSWQQLQKSTLSPALRMVKSTCSMLPKALGLIFLTMFSFRVSDGHRDLLQTVTGAV